MAKEIINQLEAALGETLHLLSKFDGQNLNKVPYEGSWTAGQVARHLEKSQTGMDELLLAPTEKADRPADEKASWLKDIFLNFESKMQSPDFILPEEKDYTKGELETPLKNIKDKTLAALDTANLEQLAPLPEQHPFHGNTKLEMVHFMAYHTIRHNHQLKKIYNALY